MAAASIPLLAMTTSNATLDNGFGPVVAQYADFTFLFEDTMFSLAPSILFLAAFPIRLIWLWRKPRKVLGGSLHANKLIMLSIFLALQIVCLGFWAAPSTAGSTAALAAAVLTVFDAIALGILSHLEHVRSVRPSVLINVYMLITLPLDAARARSLWLRGGSLNLSAAFTSTLSIKLLILIAEAFEKRDILLAQYQGGSPETTSGIYSRSFFWWLNPLLRNGFRKVLTDEDLYPVDDDMKSVAVGQRLKNGWTKEKQKTKKNALLWRLLWSVRGSLAQGIFPRLCITAFGYFQPFLITAVVKYLSEADESSEAVGWGLTLAYGLDYLGLAVANAAYMHQTFRTVTIVRGSIISAIYSQTVDLKLTSVDESAAITLMATDVERICQAFRFVHSLWSCPLEIALGVYLLWRQIGLAALGPVCLTLVSCFTVLFLSQFTSRAQMRWVEKVQSRIDVTNKIIGGMKAVKMLGLSDVMHDIIQGLRVTEVQTSLLFRKLTVLGVGLGKGTEVLAPGVAFAAFALVSYVTGQPLQVGAAYASLTIVNLLMSPLNMIIQSIPVITAAFGCFDRIQDFLNLPAKRDHRLESSFHEGSRGNAMPHSTSQTGIELGTLSTNPSIRQLCIQLVDATFSWKEDQPVIRNISLDIWEHTFSTIIGPVGCGKSTLLKGLLGETPSNQGFVYTKEMQAGFVDQTSWIQNGTFQSNILGVSLYDRDWYAAVVHACALQDDIDMLPYGDQTKVGSAGISLSGGQKQRLALARAVYSRKRLLILDDCFSGLDGSTEEKIFKRLLSQNGLLKKYAITVILVTHATHRLPFADHVIALNADGSILEQGTFEELMKQGTYVPGIFQKRAPETTQQSINEEQAVTQTMRVDPIQSQEIDRALEDTNRAVGDWKTWSYYFRSTGIANLAYFLISMIICGIFMKLPDLSITYWAAAVKIHGNSVNSLYLGIYLGAECLSVIFLVITCYSNLLLMTPRSATRLHRTILDVVMAAPLLFFTSTDLGVTINRFSQDMSLVDMELPLSFLELIADLVVGLTQAVLMCLSAGYFAATMPFVAVILYFVQQYYLRTSRQLRLLDLEAKSPLYSHFIETLEGLVTVRAFGWSHEFETKNARFLDTSQKPFYLLFCVQRWLGLVLDLTVAALTVVLMIIVVKLRFSINPGLVALALVNVNGFNLSLTELIKSWTQVETSMGAVTRVRSFSRETNDENLPGELENIPEDAKWPRKGSIEFKDLTAYYKPGHSVLKSLSLKINAGEKVGICGGSGSGKSSIIAALFRMLEIQQGSIVVDGVDITGINRQEVRRRFNAIPQDAYFFKGTVRLNLDPKSRHEDFELEAALRKVGLWSIIAGKGGLGCQAEADMFSHGQRQLFCLARAILHPSQIVVLDEATASVDLKTDEAMQKIIREIFHGCTILAVAHRLETIMDFDRIAVVKAGELVEFDTPQALMSRGSAFKSLYESH